MAPIATYVFIDIGQGFLRGERCLHVTVKVLTRKDLISKDKETIMTGGQSKYHRGYCVSQLVTDLIEPLDKPVCLVGYGRHCFTYEILKSSSNSHKTFTAEYADAMAAYYDILEPNNEKTTKEQRQMGAWPWHDRCPSKEEYSLVNVYNRVVGDGKVLWSPVATMTSIAKKLSNRFMKWIDENHSSFQSLHILNSLSIADESDERVAACREDGLAVDQALASLIIKKLSTLILKETKRVPKGPQFYESKLVDGYLRITPRTTASKVWLLSQNFGVLNGHRIVLRLTSRVCVWIPGAPNDIPKDAPVLQYLRGQNWDKPELELDKWLLSNRMELPMGTYFNFSVPSAVERNWGKDAQRQLFFGGTRVRAVITRCSRLDRPKGISSRENFHWSSTLDTRMQGRVFLFGDVKIKESASILEKD